MRVRYQYPSSVENTFNCIHFTTIDGPCIDIVSGGIVIEVDKWNRIVTDLKLTSQEQLAKLKASAAKAKKAVKDNVVRLRAEFAGEFIEPNVISIDEYMAKENVDDDEEAA